MSPYRLYFPVIQMLDPEMAHGFALHALNLGRWLMLKPSFPANLKTELWGRDFPSPVGLAAGFDKNAQVVDAAFGLAFGFVEVGTITPRPQPGNPKPRLFRLTEDAAVINRMGFDSKGALVVRRNLERRKRPGVVGINLGKNKNTEDSAADYRAGINILAPYADYLVINISSPNTPGLRALQEPAQLTDLLGTARAALMAACGPDSPPLLLKIAPDLTDEDKADIATVVLESGLQGLIATNTTLARPQDLHSPNKNQDGGLSGRPLRDLSTETLADFYRLTNGKLPLIGVGGIESGADAYAKIRAGASLVQLYSAMVFHGPGLIRRINRELAALLTEDGFDRVADAVGADHPDIKKSTKS